MTDKTIKTSRDCVEGMAHEIWAAAQLMPGEGIGDGVERIIFILSKWQDDDARKIRELQGKVEQLKETLEDD